MANYLVQVTIHQVISAQDGCEADTLASGLAKTLEADARVVRYQLAPMDRPLPERGTAAHPGRFRMPDGF